ncbi:hypothetical protein MTO96_012958 [Rhipicephalus appendiculatus]
MDAMDADWFERDLLQRPVGTPGNDNRLFRCGHKRALPVAPPSPAGSPRFTAARSTLLQVQAGYPTKVHRRRLCRLPMRTTNCVVKVLLPKAADIYKVFF